MLTTFYRFFLDDVQRESRNRRISVARMTKSAYELLMSDAETLEKHANVARGTFKNFRGLRFDITDVKGFGYTLV